MKAETENFQAWKYFPASLLFIFIFSCSASAGVVRLCNGSGAQMRVAKFVLEGSSFFALDCGGFGTEGCRAKLFNWEAISDGYCKTYVTGSFYRIYFAVQLRDRDGNWYSTSYAAKQEFLDGVWDKAGWSGLSGLTMCVRDDTDSVIYDRYVQGMARAVTNEVCRTGYSKVLVNLFAQTTDDTDYAITVPYEAPPVKMNPPNTYRSADGALHPACGYVWVSGSPYGNSGDYTVRLLKGFVATPTGVRPAKGYRWVGDDRTYFCRVELIPTTKKTKPKRRIRKNR